MVKRKPLSAVDVLKQIPPRSAANNWRIRMTPQQARDVDEIKRGYQSGDLADYSMQQIWEHVSGRLKIKVGKTQFRTWIRRDDA